MKNIRRNMSFKSTGKRTTFTHVHESIYPFKIRKKIYWECPFLFSAIVCFKILCLCIFKNAGMEMISYILKKTKTGTEPVRYHRDNCIRK